MRTGEELQDTALQLNMLDGKNHTEHKDCHPSFLLLLRQFFPTTFEL